MLVVGGIVYKNKTHKIIQLNWVKKYKNAYIVNERLENKHSSTTYNKNLN